MNDLNAFRQCEIVLGLLSRPCGTPDELRLYAPMQPEVWVDSVAERFLLGAMDNMLKLLPQTRATAYKRLYRDVLLILKQIY